jgi:hypothetical protein
VNEHSYYTPPTATGTDSREARGECRRLWHLAVGEVPREVARLLDLADALEDAENAPESSPSKPPALMQTPHAGQVATPAIPRPVTTLRPQPPPPDVPGLDTPVSILLFEPATLYAGGPPFVFQSGAVRRVVTGEWMRLASFLARSVEGDPSLDPNIAKRARGAWVPGTYRQGSGHASLARDFVCTDLVVADVDAGDPHRVATELAAYAAIVHSTYKHKPGAPRCRVVLRCAGPLMTAREYNTVLGFVATYLNGKGFVCPSKDSTLGKLAFLPMHQPGVTPVHIVTTGKSLPVDRLLALAPQATARQTPRSAKEARSSSELSGAIAYAASKVAAAGAGQRHNTRYGQARWLAELGADDEAIKNACLEPDSDETAVKTVEDAIAKGRES